jgi:hypothetical protein
VHLWLAYKRLRRVGKFAVVGVMLALWVATSAISASPQLHHLLHQDSQHPNHYCFFTQLNQHSLLAGLTPAHLPERSLCATDAPALSVSELLPSFDYVVSHGRAPPSFFPSTAVVG